MKIARRNGQLAFSGHSSLNLPTSFSRFATVIEPFPARNFARKSVRP
jgi:hypothetical protein